MRGICQLCQDNLGDKIAFAAVTLLLGQPFWEERSEHFTEFSKLKKNRNLYQKEAQRFDELSVDMISAVALARNSVELVNVNGGKNIMSNELVLFNQPYNAEVDLETVSAFQQVDAICKNAELYSCSNPHQYFLSEDR